MKNEILLERSMKLESIWVNTKYDNKGQIISEKKFKNP
jgi:hypothetical protein